MELDKIISPETLQWIGLCVVLMYIVVGFDDIIWDLVTLIKRVSSPKPVLDISKLEEVPPKLLAIAIGAWKEDNVLGDVVDNIIASAHYPKSMYHIFLGVYPNDDRTLAVAYELSERHSNVYVVVNNKPGPTSKAQNINYTIQRIKDFEKEKNWSFASITVHDSEDVVHPYEFKVTNYLIDSHQALQFPVFPLVPMPTLRNFFQYLTSGTYADEFAETHFYTMVNRHRMGALVPSAGTGFVLSKSLLNQYGGHNLLSLDSLTEDYLLSWNLFSKGIQMYFVLEQVRRVNYKNKKVTEFVATRSMFPNSFKTAVKQKTRWILGITMQSLGVKDVFKAKGVPFVGRYSLYKDQKAKFGNILVLVGYPVLTYFIFSLFMDIPPMYPKGSLSWYLCVFVTIMMLARQFYRGIAIYNVYGMRSVFFACLVPPFLPIRLMWGNLINLSATLSAFKQKIFGNRKKEPKRLNSPTVSGKKKLVWDKTEHSFLEKYILERYHRSLGDVLIEKKYIDESTLLDAIETSKHQKQLLGDYLLSQKMITEKQLLNALASLKHTQFVDRETLPDYMLSGHAHIFEERLLRELKALPLFPDKDGFVIAFCEESPIYAQSILRKQYNLKIHAVFATLDTILDGIKRMYSSDQVSISAPGLSDELLKRGQINFEQKIICQNYYRRIRWSQEQIAKYMGFLQ